MKAQFGDKAAHRDIALLFVGAALYRLLFLALSPRVLDTADAVHYVEAALHLRAGEFLGYDPKIPLMYPLLGAFANLFIPDIEWACRAVSLCFSILTIIPVYLLARELHGRATARIAGLAVCLWPWLADYGCSVATEAVAVFLWFLAAWLLARAVRCGGFATLLAPFLFFALHLTRPEGTFLLLFAPVAALALCLGRGERERERREPDRSAPWRRLASYILIASALLLLNTLFVRRLAGQTTVNFRIGFIIEEFDFLRFAQTAVESSHNVFPIMLGPVLLLFLGVGFFAPRETPRDWRLELYVLLLAAAQWGVSLFVLSPAPRYYMAPIIALSLWSASGMVTVGNMAARAPRWGGTLRVLPVAALVAAMLLGAAITLGSEHLGRRPRQPREYKIAGEWMREHLEPGLVFTRKPQVAFYAGMDSTGPEEDDTLEQALDRARGAQARYIVVDERYAPAGLRPLLDPGQAPAQLRYVYACTPYPESKVVIYELVSLPE